MERHTYNHSAYKLLAIITDFLLAYLSCKLSYWVVFGLERVNEDHYLSFFIIFSLLWICLAGFNNLYKQEFIFSFEVLINRFPYTLVAQVVFTLLYAFYLTQYSFSDKFILFAIIYSGVSIFFVRFVLILGYKYRRLLHKNFKVVVVGGGGTVDDLISFFSDVRINAMRYDEFNEIAYAGDGHFDDEHIYNFKAFCLENDISEIYFALPVQNTSILEDLIDFADNHYIYFKIVKDVKVFEKSENRYIYLKDSPELEVLEGEDITVDFYGSTPIISLKKQPLKPMLSRLSKRAFDFAFSTLAMIFVVMPIIMVIGAMIKLESKGPVFFKQKRSGRKNKEFLVYKFRTMYVQPPDAKYKQATKDDPRVTKIGKFLRKTSLDELPQFINVFLGHMSVVGPRPHPIPLNDEYAPQIEKYLYRYFITPGITGHAQINGYRGETSDPYLMEKRVEYDHWYIENWSFWLDIKIIILTILNVFKGEENAY